VTLLIVGAVLVIAVVSAIIEKLTGRRPSPHPGEIWFASVPFASDWTTSKDRPVLIVRVTGTTLMVRTITSQDQSRRGDHYEFLPVTGSGLDKPSWLKRQPETLSVSRLRRRVGRLAVATAPR
jgi:mRNA-degrading endonuclease toxin of MazEF toxin-antitoxin module